MRDGTPILPARVVLALGLCLALCPQTSLAQTSARRLRAAYDTRLHATCLPEPSWPDAQDVVRWAHTEIPRRIVQIWFGSYPQRWAQHLAAWQQYADTFGYSYRLYTDADVDEILHDAAPEVVSLFYELQRRHEFRGLSDVARYLLLHQGGGLYIDADMRLPRWAGEAVDFAALLPLRGLFVVSDGAPVDWGVGGLHVLNGIMGACPKHPTLRALLHEVASNAACCRKAGQNSPVLATGPAPLTLLLQTPVTVVPTVLWDAFGVSDPQWR